MDRADSSFTDGTVFGLSTTEFTAESIVSRGDEPTSSALENWSDRELSDAVMSRNDSAFTELFRRHYRSVVRSSRMILANVSESEDVGAEVLLEYWLDPEKFDPDRGTLLSFLRVKAKGRSIDVIRAETSRSRRERLDADRAELFELGVDVSLLSTESKTRLRTALNELPLGEREPIELAFFGGLTYIAVAQRLGLPEGTAKARIRGGLRRLRSMCLDEDLRAPKSFDTAEAHHPALAHSDRERASRD